MISLGIGDPDTPTPALRGRRSGRGGRRRRARTSTPRTAAAPSSARPCAAFYERRFGVTLDPATEIVPALGAKECIFNLNLAFLDPGDSPSRPIPATPSTPAARCWSAPRPYLMPLLPERGFAPDLRAIAADARERARLIYLNYPNNPTGAVVPDGLVRGGRRVRPRPRRARGPRRLLHRDDLRRLRGAELPCHARGQGRRRRGLLALQGLQHDRLAHGGHRRQRRGRGGLLAAQDQHRLRDVRGGAAGRRARRCDRRATIAARG